MHVAIKKFVNQVDFPSWEFVFPKKKELIAIMHKDLSLMQTAMIWDLTPYPWGSGIKFDIINADRDFYQFSYYENTDPQNNSNP